MAAKPCALEGDTRKSVGERAAVTPELLRVLRERYGIRWRGEVVDLGGSVNLNIYLPADDGGLVAQVRNVLPPFCNLWHVRDEAVKRAYVGQITLEVEWSLELLAELDQWQRGFA